MLTPKKIQNLTLDPPYTLKAYSTYRSRRQTAQKDLSEQTACTEFTLLSADRIFFVSRNLDIGAN